MIDFSKKYNREEVLEFLQGDFLKDFQKDIRKVGVSGDRFIKNAFSLGSSKDLELGIFEFEHTGSTEKRVSLTKEAFQILKESGFYRALAFFHSKDTDDWRFSFMTITPTLTEKGKIKKEFSNPKRFSFLLGPRAKVNTPTQFLIQKGPIESLEDLKERFSIEVVNKEFYKKISELFVELVGGTLGTGKSKEEYKGLLKLPGTEPKSKEAQEFAVRLIGRLIFCWFLREKKNGSEDSLMPNSLLSYEASKEHTDYYHEVLEPIFFKVLNVPIDSRKEEKYSKDPYGQIPYLNGGLFTPHDDDYYSNIESKEKEYREVVLVSDKWIQKLFKILETYNFTIDENSSFDEELSIDPEMLGRIFENLLAEINPETGESARKSTGSFYTPRVIVDYMVDESLYLYLENKTEIGEDKLRALISYDLEDDIDNSLNNKEKEEIINAIDELKILDPACGSGAFPMGILQKIVFVLQQLDPKGQFWFKKQRERASVQLRKNLEREHEEENFDYIRKLGVIRRNIFGVDIQPIATEISRLRCFLTLIVDQKVDDTKDNRGIDPLPNLDFKFVTANSLISLPEKDKYGQSDWLQDETGIEKLKELREEFFNADISVKDALIAKFARIQRDMALRNSKDSVGDYTKYLTEWDPFSHNKTPWFDSEWMFGIKKGFDIVIGNPPYIQLQDKTKNLAEVYENLGYETFSRTADIYCLFYERAYELVKRGSGIITLITSNKWMKQNYGQNLRLFLTNSVSPHKIINFVGVKVFEAAIVDTNILICKTEKKRDAQQINACNANSDYNFGLPLKNYFSENSISVNIPTDGTAWIILSKEDHAVSKKITQVGRPLKDWDINLSRGILTGFNKAFVINKKERDSLINKDPKSKEIIKPLLRGRDAADYYEKGVKVYLLNTHNGNREQSLKRIDVTNYPEIYKHLKIYKERLISRQDQGDHWTNLRNCAYLEEFEKWKVAFPVINRKWRFLLVEPGTYILAPMRFLSSEDKDTLLFISALLSSNVIKFFWKLYCSMQDDTGYQMDNYMMEMAPLVQPRDSQRAQVIVKMQEIIELKKRGGETNLEVKELNELVYQLYDLTEEEIELIEKSTNP